LGFPTDPDDLRRIMATRVVELLLGLPTTGVISSPELDSEALHFDA
jgi:hypothetical protein